MYFTRGNSTNRTLNRLYQWVYTTTKYNAGCSNTLKHYEIGLIQASSYSTAKNVQISKYSRTRLVNMYFLQLWISFPRILTKIGNMFG